MVAEGALMLLAGKHRAAAAAVGALLATGSLCTRFAVYHAGRASAIDPLHLGAAAGTGSAARPAGRHEVTGARKERAFPGVWTAFTPL